MQEIDKRNAPKTGASARHFFGSERIAAPPKETNGIDWHF